MDDSEPPPAKRLRADSETGVALGEETFPTREALAGRVKELQTAGEAKALDGSNLALAMALIQEHPTLSSLATSNVRFGEHARFPGAKCFLISVNEGQRDERDEPGSFKKVIDKLFPRVKKAAAAGDGGGGSAGGGAKRGETSKPVPKTESASAAAEAPKETPEEAVAAPKYAAVPPPPTAASGKGGKGGKGGGGGGVGGGQQAATWFDEQGAGEGKVVVVEGLGRVNPYGGGVTVKQLKESFAYHGRVAFVDLVETEGRCYVRFLDAESASSAQRNPTPLRGLGSTELAATLLTGEEHAQYVLRARRASAVALDAKQHQHQQQRSNSKSANKGKGERQGHYGPTSS